ncbi:MAG: outer membrane protein transport protein [Pseudomonadota bacterium]
MTTTWRTLVSAAALCPALATADNGYFQIGYGAEARGLAGAAAASTRDAFGGASNPATTVWVGDRMEGNFIATRGDTRMVRTANMPPPATGLLDTRTDSLGRWEPLAELAISRAIAPGLSAGLVAYSNGAGTYFPADSTPCPSPGGAVQRANAACGTGRSITTIKQLTVAPTVSKQLGERWSVGASLLLTAQQFKAEGVQPLAPQSAAPLHLSNQGVASSFGVGFRIGAYWRASDTLSLGAAWSPRTRMGRIKAYEGLLADHGRLDVPMNLLVGLQWSPTEALSVLLDYQRIGYAGVAGLGNRPFDGSVLRGAAGGPGNGWKDMNVVKLGVRYQATPALRLSAGVLANSAAYADAATSDNLNSPSTFRRHFTLGLGYATSARTEWSVFYSLAPAHRTSGPSALAAAVGAQLNGVSNPWGRESLATRQQSLGVQYAVRF